MPAATAMPAATTPPATGATHLGRPDLGSWNRPSSPKLQAEVTPARGRRSSTRPAGSTAQSSTPCWVELRKARQRQRDKQKRAALKAGLPWPPPVVKAPAKPRRKKGELPYPGWTPHVPRPLPSR